MNRGLLAQHYQTPLIEVNDEKFENEEYIRRIVLKIFEDLGIPDNIVKRHALILFNDVKGVLLSLRCCIVDSHLNTVEDVNWNEYIKVNESTIADEVFDRTSAFNNPTSGLKYTQKAKDKKKQKEQSRKKIKKETLPDLS